MTNQPSSAQPVSSLRRVFTHTAVVCLLLTTITLAAYWPVTRAGFINYDDNEYVTQNPHVRAGLNWKGVAWALTANHASNWHPLTWWSHMVDVSLFGKGPTAPHCINLLFHLCNSILLFLFLRMVTARYWRSALVAALFALHPLHVESVAWVSERKDVLSTFFWMLTLLTYGKYAANPEAPGLKPKAYYLLSLALFILGLMSKPMLVTLPCVMLLLDVWPLRRFPSSTSGRAVSTGAKLVAEKVPFLALSAAACFVTTWAQTKTIAPLVYYPLPDRLANIVVAYCRYLEKMIWPSDLALPYLHPGPWPDAQVAISAVFIAGLSIAAFFLWRKVPHLFVGWLWYLGTLVPVIGLVQVGVQCLADRYTYIPLIGIFICLVWIIADYIPRWRLPYGLVVGAVTTALVTCSVLTYKQAGYWRDTETLFIHSAQASPNNFVALSNVGGSLFERGKLDEALRYYLESYRINPHYPEAMNSIGAVLAAKESDEAEDWFQKALLLQPNHADALFNMGNAMAKKENLREAERYFRESLSVKPDNFEAQNNLGNTLFKMGSLDAAIIAYHQALINNPYGAIIYKNLGEALAAKGKLREAIAQYQQALSYTNDPGTHYSLGLTFAVQGQWPQAIENFQATLNLSPTNAEAHYNLGYAFRMSNRPDEAVKHLQRAIELNSSLALAHYNLGCALIELNRPEQAAKPLKEALRLKPDYTDARQKLQSIDPLLQTAPQ